MRRGMKLLLWFTGVIALSSVALLIAIDLSIYQPHRAQVQQILADAAPAERNPPQAVLRVIKASSINVGALAARTLVRKFEESPPHRGMLQWHAVNLAWWLCAALHLSEKEQPAVYLSLAPMGKGIEGFSNASTAIVGVPLGKVTLEQAATLLAVSKSPASLEQPDRLARQAAALLQRTHGDP
jgi:hypothetical protein